MQRAELENAVERMEETLRAHELPWSRLEEVEDLPVSNFEEAKQNIREGRYQLGINFTAANKVAQGLYGRGYALQTVFLASLGKVFGLGLVVGALVTQEWLLLVGLGVLPVATLAGNPYSQIPTPGAVSIIGLGLLAGIAFTLEWLVLIAVAASLAFGARRWLYRRNQKRLQEVALDSEAVFLHLFHDGLLGLRDPSTGQQHWYEEAMLQRAKQYHGATTRA